ncbi:phospholipase/carboxylesterase [Gammaproteobacteria bacterium]
MLRTLEINPEIAPRASVILLHGLGASGHDFFDIAKQLNLPKELGVRFVFPHAPVRPVQYAGNAKMRAWFDLVSLEPHAKEDEAGMRKSEGMIIELIAQELARGIPSEKIILAGFSQGGAMALQCGLRYPEKLAGILVLSAWLPLAHMVFAERSIANQRIPILMLHGTGDSVIPLKWAMESCNFLKEMGYHVTMSSYPMQHAVCPEEIVAIGVWLRKVLS